MQRPLDAASTGEAVAEGRIRYHAANVTVRVPSIDEAARDELAAAAIAQARRLRESIERPPMRATTNVSAPAARWRRSVLPEEVRQVASRSVNRVRLFPPDRDGTSLHVSTQGRPSVAAQATSSLVVEPRGQRAETKHPIAASTPVISCTATPRSSTQALRKCVEHDVGVHWLTAAGCHTASLCATAGQVQRRVRQYRAWPTRPDCLRLARPLVQAKVEGQHRYLLRGTRGDGRGGAGESLPASTFAL